MSDKGTALVTGASRGIGKAVALELAARGYEVVATMRNPADGAELEDGSAGRIRVARLDVTDPDTIDLPDDLSVLINNAGIEAEYLPVEHTPMQQWRSVFETNVMGLVDVTRQAIPIMRTRGSGVICNITSSSILTGMPLYAVYRASKAAVAALSESLRSEVSSFGIRVLEVLPGPIDTDMLAASARLPEAAQHDGYEDLAKRVYDGRMSAEELTCSTQDAAASIVDAIDDQDSPNKVGCDPLSRDLLAAFWAEPEALLGAGV